MKQVIITIGTILFTTFLYGQGGVGINNSGNAPNTSAMLDVASTNKGLLIPRVSLTSTTDITTITNGNVTSLLVYNSATIADVVPGYYYWDGTVWKTIGGNDADADPTNEIQDLQLVGNNLTITNNGTPTAIDLSAYLDNTDDQNIDSVILNSGNLTVYIEDGTSSAVDLSSLSDHDWYEVGGATAPDNINDDIYTQGDVGIGEILPKASLDVDGDIIFGGVSSIEWHLKSTSGRGILASGPNYNAGKERVNFRPIGGGGQFFQMTVDDASSQLFPNYSFISDNNTGFFNRAGSPDHLYFATNGVERQVIDANGNVGIGESTPLTRLEVVENTDFVANFARADNIPGNEVGISLGTNNTSHIDKNAYIKAIEGGGINVWSLAFGTSNMSNTSIERMRILTNGNIGMGITNPTNKLSIGTNLGTGYGISVNSGSPYGGIIETAESPATNNPAFWVRTNDGGSISHLLRVQNNGNVGIGTISPTNKLDINGDLRIQTITPGSGADVALVADATGVVKQVAPNPVGEIIIFPVTTPPTGYLICDGSAISRTTYSDLFAVLGTSYGLGDGSTTFNLPDLRGEFVRGSDNGRGADTGRTIGSWQKGSIAAMDLPTVGVWGISTQQTTALAARNDLGYDSFTTSDYATGQLTGTNSVVTTPITQNSDGASGVTRPRNVAMNYCIRF